MKNRCRRTQLVIGLAIFVVAASRPVGMRVEVQALPVAGDETTLVVSSTVAPEDRGRIGTQARMRIKLLRGDAAVLHRLLDVDVDVDGKAQAEIAAPRGTFELEVELTAVRGDSAGFWRGTVEVPVESDGEVPALMAPPEPAPATAVTATGASSTQAVVQPRVVATPAPAPAAEEPEPVIAATNSQTETTTDFEPNERPVKTAPAPVMPTIDPELVVSGTVVSPIVGAQSHEPPRDVQVDITSAETTLVFPNTVPMAGMAPNEPSTPVVQGTRPSPAGPTPEAPSQKSAPTTAPSPQGPDKPVAYLIALEVAEENLGRASAVYEHFLRVAQRDGFTAIEILPRTDATTTALTRLAGALDSIAQPPGGATLVLVTDGLRPQARAEWKAADATILQAGAPLLAVGLWSDAFSAGTRKYLGRTAVYSGGRFYLLQTGEATTSVVSFFGLGE